MIWPLKRKPKPQPERPIGWRAIQWAAPWGEIVWVCKFRRADGSEYTARKFPGAPITFPTEQSADRWARLVVNGEGLA